MKSYFKLKDRCPTCGFVFERGEHGYQIGSMAIDLVTPLIIWFFSFFGILYATWPNPPWFWLQWGSVAFMVLFPQPTRVRPAVEYIPLPYRGARQGR